MMMMVTDLLTEAGDGGSRGDVLVIGGLQLATDIIMLSFQKVILI